MFNIDTAKPIDVIKRSYSLHPSLLREALRSRMKTHFDYSIVTDSLNVARHARTCGNDIFEALTLLDQENFDSIEAAIRLWVPLFNSASRLLLIPSYKQTEIVGRI